MIILDVSLASSLQSCMLNRRPSSSFTSESVCPPRKVRRNYRICFPSKLKFLRFFPFLARPLQAYFIINNRIYQSPDMYTVLSNRLARTPFSSPFEFLASLTLTTGPLG